MAAFVCTGAFGECGSPLGVVSVSASRPARLTSGGGLSGTLLSRRNISHLHAGDSAFSFTVFSILSILSILHCCSPAYSKLLSLLLATLAIIPRTTAV
ncbi:hypothetical protein BO82DRAFT_360006 [Aspergillus uvarum CBS 121591]|uniref:Uncharacterized protein n=1 Tax=Aspergillus uvarum CBS 121591 TaxID=1448315 RepID=A0A319BSL2_9EURO|nr:hypothetical protein BO82DRAFT_360006 [Aspergillus uvarum CBS 121591]PYH75461.1 hypothetical protein BO82DRAFT_360006 [Aspergillus uvarum CBS 121591]